jgi:hypothetical protein
VKIANETPKEDLWIAKFPWKYGKPGETKGFITGEDVVMVVDGKIKALYAFIDPPVISDIVEPPSKGLRD